MAEARDFKFGTLLGFANAHHKNTPIYFGFFFNITATAALSS